MCVMKVKVKIFLGVMFVVWIGCLIMMILGYTIFREKGKTKEGKEYDYAHPYLTWVGMILTCMVVPMTTGAGLMAMQNKSSSDKRKGDKHASTKNVGVEHVVASKDSGSNGRQKSYPKTEPTTNAKSTKSTAYLKEN